MKAGCALSGTGQCYGSGQGFPGNVVVCHTFIHGGFKSPGVPQLLPSSPGYRRAQLPVLRMHILPRPIMTGKTAVRWLSPNGFTTLKMPDNH